MNSYNIIYISPGSYSDHFHRKPFITALSKNKNVKKLILLEPASDFFHAPLKNKKRFLNAISSLFKTKKENSKISSFTPFLFLHPLIAKKFKLLNKVNVFLYSLSFKNFIKRENLEKNILLFASNPDNLNYMPRNLKYKLIYDCYDDHLITYKGEEIKNATLSEISLIKKSSFVFCTSQKLLNKSLKYNSHSYLNHNGADVFLFSKALNSKVTKPKDISKIKSPIVGYVGEIRDWMDFDLLEFLITNSKDKSFVFIGKINKNVKSEVKKLKRYKNVFFIGKKNYEDLYKYLRFIDIAIIPNKVNEFNESVLPIKLFEYLAARKIIITTNHCIDLKLYYDDFVEIANSENEFLAILNKGHEILNLKANCECSKNISWANRSEEIFKLIY